MRSEGKARKMIILSLILVLGLPLVITVPAMAYTIDGDLDDWGVNLSKDWSLNSTWVPSGDTIDWIVEDNIDPDCPTHGDPDEAWPKTGWKGHNCLDWTGYNATGVHIKGTGSSYSTYNEPVFPDYGGIYEQPAGGENLDIEAMYFDDDSHYAYFAIVISMGPNGFAETRPGDLALDLDNNPSTGEYGYEYGIILVNSNGSINGTICHDPDWSEPTDFPSSKPMRIENCSSATGTATVVYENTSISDYGAGNWVIEIKAPKTALGEPLYQQISNLHATITCGNDVIEIEEVSWDYEIPEFATIAIPVSMIFGLFYYYRRKRQGEGENKSE